MLVGYTTGVFDLFHSGHLNILKRAKANCDYLIVGVSTDELVSSYKDKSPIVSFHERFEIIQAIKYVDKVVPQESMDKLVAWEKLKFNLHFHGNDWKDSTYYNELQKKFNKVGVKQIYFPYTKGTSTSYLKEKIYNVVFTENKKTV